MPDVKRSPRGRAGARRAAAVAATLALISGSAGPATAQIPDTFTNLQVLPKEIDKGRLVSVMRDFAGALGVRCNHCHVGQDAATLQGFDFAADDKEPKKVARAMMKMAREINEKLLPAAGRAAPIEVRCITCHRGLTKPQTLDRLLMEVVEKEGVAAALARYRELRSAQLGQGTYDFSHRTLFVLAEDLARRRKDLDGALEATRLNVELNADLPHLHFMMGQLLMQKGDRAAALASFEKCLALDPQHTGAKRQIESLKTQPTSP